MDSEFCVSIRNYEFKIIPHCSNTRQYLFSFLGKRVTFVECYILLVDKLLLFCIILVCLYSCQCCCGRDAEDSIFCFASSLLALTIGRQKETGSEEEKTCSYLFATLCVLFLFISLSNNCTTAIFFLYRPFIRAIMSQIPAPTLGYSHLWSLGHSSTSSFAKCRNIGNS